MVSIRLHRIQGHIHLYASIYRYMPDPPDRRHIHLYASFDSILESQLEYATRVVDCEVAPKVEPALTRGLQIRRGFVNTPSTTMLDVSVHISADA